MSELKPCPFCGAEAKYVHIFTFDKDIHEVRCTNCYARTPAVFQKEDAIKRWNRRVKE